MRATNKVVLVGNLGNNPELRHSKKGERAVTNFNACTNEYRKNANGDKVHHPEWHKIVVWGDLAELCVENLGKGSKIYLEGRLQTRQRTTADGNTFPVTEIVAQRIDFLDRRDNGGNGGGGRDDEEYGYDDDDGEDIDVEAEVSRSFEK